MPQASQVRTYDPAASVVFLKTNERFGGLSNMAPGFPLLVNGIRIRTSEALYQACRFPHMPDVQRRIIDEHSPMTAKMRSKPFRKDSRPDWDTVRVKIMRWCLRVKLAQNWREFSRLLLATGDRPIVEQSRKDDFWGARITGDGVLVGMNVLGRLLMELREQLKAETSRSPKIVEPLAIPEFLLLNQPIQTVFSSEGIAKSTHEDGNQKPSLPSPSSMNHSQPSLFDRSSGDQVRRDAEGTQGTQLQGSKSLGPYASYRDSGVPWLGHIPAHWDTRRNGRLFTQRNDTGHEDLPILEVSLRTGIRVRDLDNGARKQQMGDRSKYKRAARGDIAYNMMRMWQGAVGITPIDGLVSPAYVVARPFSEVDAAYYAHLFRTAAYMREVDVFSRGIVPDRNRLYWEAFKQISSVYPPPDEQRLIVRFLNRHGGRTAKLIRGRKQLIALLEEQKQAIIHRAVTRGLDPNVRLKPSGVEWLGDVPEHWEVLTLRRVITRAVDGPHHSPSYLDNGIPFLSARNIKTDRWSLEDAKFISDEDYAEFSKRITPEVGDVLYTKGGTTGIARAVDLPFRFQVWVHVAVLKLKRHKVVPRYLALVLNSPRSYEQAQLFTRGATNQDLGLGRMKGIWFAIPPLPEQERILTTLEDETQNLLAAIHDARREIQLLREYRTRLIADVVTGKLDVREAAARLPDEVEEAEPLDEIEAEDQNDEASADDSTEVPEEAEA